MVSLISQIPVKTPQSNNIQSVPTDAKNPYPQLKKYDYIPAKPLSPARTKTKFTRPIAASGEIINETVYQSAVSTVKSYKEYAKNFYDAAFKGEGNDYKVGKINDLSIRAGSLGIASILATTKFFPFAKGMEFVGLGTWFAAMALWPQIIGAPIKALTGVNINQKYKDSYGKRKNVFEDNQYRPMDIYRHLDKNGKLLSEKEYYQKYQYDYVYLDKIADKMGIPKNQKNRHEATMEKMGQVAVQGRTLSMLTAGVMTPVLSSVVADALQHPVKSAIESIRKYMNLSSINSLDADLKIMDKPQNLKTRTTETNIDKVIEKLGISLSEKNKLESLINNTQYLSKQEFEEVEKIFEELTRGSLLKEPFEEYTENVLTYKEPKLSLNKTTWETIQKTTADSVKEALSDFDKEILDKLPNSIKNYEGITENDFVEIIQKAIANNGSNYVQNYNQNIVTELNTQEVNAISNAVLRKINENFQKANIDDEILDKIKDTLLKNLDKTIESQKHHVIGNDNLKLMQLYKFIETDKAIRARIEKFEKATIENVSESITANNWEKLPAQYLDILGFNKQEIAKMATMDSSAAGDIVRQKLDEIVSDSGRYESTITKLSQKAAQAIEREEKAVLSLIGTIQEGGVLTNAKDLMSSIARFSFGSNMEAAINRNYSNKIKSIQYKFRNTTDSFVRAIKALDTFKNIDESVNLIIGHNPQEYEQALKNPNFYMFSNLKYDEAKNALIDFIKDVVVDKNDINDWSTKLEHDLTGTKKGMKHSMHLLRKIAEIVNGPLNQKTADIVDTNKNKFIGNIEKFIIKKLKLKQITDSPMTLSNKINLNNAIMRFRYLNIKSKLAIDYNDCGKCYMQDTLPSKALIKDIFYNNWSNVYLLKGMLAERREQITLPQIAEVKKLIENIEGKNDYKLYEDSAIFNYLDFGTADKEIAEMSGKNISDFFAQAAQNNRSRNKWTKVAYGLLLGTTALTAFVISQIGKDNYFNPSEKKQKEKQVNNANIQ